MMIVSAMDGWHHEQCGGVSQKTNTRFAGGSIILWGRNTTNAYTELNVVFRIITVQLYRDEILASFVVLFTRTICGYCGTPIV